MPECYLHSKGRRAFRCKWPRKRRLYHVPGENVFDSPVSTETACSTYVCSFSQCTVNSAALPLPNIPNGHTSCNSASGRRPRPRPRLIFLDFSILIPRPIVEILLALTYSLFTPSFVRPYPCNSCIATRIVRDIILRIIAEAPPPSWH